MDWHDKATGTGIYYTTYISYISNYSIITIVMILFLSFCCKPMKKDPSRNIVPMLLS